jgi:hypothetical protein
MSTAPQEAKKLVNKEADEELKEEAEEILNESKTQKEQGKALASVATGIDKRELDTTKVQKVPGYYVFSQSYKICNVKFTFLFIYLFI